VASPTETVIVSYCALTPSRCPFQRPNKAIVDHQHYLTYITRLMAALAAPARTRTAQEFSTLMLLSGTFLEAVEGGLGATHAQTCEHTSSEAIRRGPPGKSGTCELGLIIFHTQACFSCKKLRNPLLKVPRKDVGLWKSCRGNAGEATGVLWVTLCGVTHTLAQIKYPAVKSRRKPITMTASDFLTQWSTSVQGVTVCVAVLRQLHGLLTAGRLYTPTASAT